MHVVLVRDQGSPALGVLGERRADRAKNQISLVHQLKETA
jgi:hypothetical protein